MIRDRCSSDQSLRRDHSATERLASLQPRWRRWLGAAGIAVLLIAGTALAQEANRGGALDDKLLFDLAPLVESRPSESLPATEKRGITVETQRGPFQRIQRRMVNVRERLTRFDITAKTRSEQAIIITQIDGLLSRLEPVQDPATTSSRSMTELGNNAAGNRLRSAQASQVPGNRPGTPQGHVEGMNVATPARAKLLDEAWGSLPAQKRQQLRAARPEIFLPQYSQLIEDYYKRLAEEPRQ